MRLDREMKIKTTYVPFKGTGDLLVIGAGRSRVGDDVVFDARDPAEGQDADAGRRDREAPAAVSRRADVSELGLNWVDGAYRGIGVPKSTPPAVRKEVSDMMDAINKDPEHRKKMFEGGFEVVDVRSR